MNEADQPYAIGRGLCAIRGLDADDSKFVRYALQLTLPSLLSGVTGSTFPNLSRDQIAGHEIPIPPRQMRQAISEILCVLDDKISANERLARDAFALADAMALGVMRSTATELRSMRFGDLGEIFDGPHATPTRCTEGPYFLSISSLKSGRLDLAESDHVSESDFLKWTRRVTPQADDLLFSYETRLGEAALMPDGVRACLGRRMALLRADRNRVDPHFLLHFYLSPSFQRIIAARTIHGATVPRIGLATMGHWAIEIALLHEQEAIAGSLRSLHETVVQADCESSWLADVRDELLPLLMSGKVRIKDIQPVTSEVS
jgi:type I restriction enzyme S subunit